eukprot:TRINITY_DN40386_c0_g1_i1.p1 TRINITY_DN40386_c0_g1~~TRINITY_DN40386_c0_g1_i1.p1  ORF type:complete len:401 (-),score=39.60 TRINITY_DN40386_c0_g1_i1:105-1196(-)
MEPMQWPGAQVLLISGRADHVWNSQCVTQQKLTVQEIKFFDPSLVEELNLTWTMFIGDSNLRNVWLQFEANLGRFGHAKNQLECKTYAASKAEYARYLSGQIKWWQDTEKLCVYRWSDWPQRKHVYFRQSFRFLQQKSFSRQSEKVRVHLAQPSRMFLTDGITEWDIKEKFGAGLFPHDILNLPFMERRNETKFYKASQLPSSNTTTTRLMWGSTVSGFPANSDILGKVKEERPAYPDVVWLAPGLWWPPSDVTSPDGCANIRWFFEALVMSPASFRLWQNVPEATKASPANKAKSDVWFACERDKMQWNFSDAVMNRLQTVKDTIYTMDLHGLPTEDGFHLSFIPMMQLTYQAFTSTMKALR